MSAKVDKCYIRNFKVPVHDVIENFSLKRHVVEKKDFYALTLMRAYPTSEREREK